MIDLGKLNGRLKLVCPLCQWIPPDETKMEAVKLHIEIDHDTEEVRLSLSPICSCGAVMTSTHSRESSPGSGRFKDYHRCPACSNTGFIVRTPRGVSQK